MNWLFLRTRKELSIILISLWTCVFFVPTLAYAEDSQSNTLTEEQKNEKRLLFSQYVEEQFEQAKKKKAEEAQAATQKPLITRVSSSYGYDSNVNLDSSHRGDAFYQGSAEGSVEFGKSIALPLPWEGKSGVKWYTEVLAYESMEASDYHTSTITPFVEEKLSPQLNLKMTYDLNIVRYFNNDQLTYFGHKFKPTLTHYTTQHFSQNTFASYELKYFRDRRALSPSSLPLDGTRRDDYYESGYGVRYYPTDKTFMGITAAWKLNDSNDLYHDTNDYDGYKINGFIYQKFNDRVSAVGFVGYDRKNYPSKTFVTGSAVTEKDDFYYWGGYAYYDLNKNWQAFLSYLYKQNNSNDPAQEYVGYTSSGGFNLSF